MSAPAGTPRRLARYVFTAFLRNFVITLLVLVALFLIVDGATQAGNFVKSGREGMAGHLLRYYMLQLPVIFVQIGPVVTLVGAAFALTRLRKSGELLPILASGISLHRVLRSVVLFALAMAAVSVALEQWVIPTASQAKRTGGLSITREKQIYNLLVTDHEADLLLFIGKYVPSTAAMENVHVFEMDRADGAWRVRAHIHARRGEPHAGGGWRLDDGHRLAYAADGRRETATGADRFNALHYTRTKLLPDDVQNASRVGVSLRGGAGLEARASLSELYALTRSPAAPAAPRARFHARLAHPLAHLALLLAGLPLVLRRESRNVFAGPLLAGAVCAVYFLLQAICFDLGIRGVISPAMAGWAPAGILISIGWYRWSTLPT
ncbi:MAG: LptF/LptG family permease [Planctomycetota bacterium]|jgi:lipopolysaccharide export LptBFGC system permease protein LptF